MRFGRSVAEEAEVYLSEVLPAEERSAGLEARAAQLVVIN